MGACSLLEFVSFDAVAFAFGIVPLMPLMTLEDTFFIDGSSPETSGTGMPLFNTDGSRPVGTAMALVPGGVASVGGTGAPAGATGVGDVVAGAAPGVLPVMDCR